MRSRLLTLAVLAAIAGAVVVSLRGEERFVVEGARLERTAGGVRVAGTLRNDGARAEQVAIEVTMIGADGRPSEKETVALQGVEAGASVPFASRPSAGEVRAFSVKVDEGKNPYGN